MRYYPICIDTRNKKVLILGGGNVATRKAKTLLKTEFTIYLASKEFSEELQALQQLYPSRIFLECTELTSDYELMDYDYLITATDDEALNESIAQKAKKQKVAYVRSDRAGDSSFIMTKVIENGSILIGVSAGGQNPSITQLIAKDIEEVLRKQSPKKLELLAEVREELVKRRQTDIKETIVRLYHKDIHEIQKYLEALYENYTRD